MYSKKSEDEQEPKRTVYDCPECDHKTVDPEPDEDGDRVCDECGCILPEKKAYECESCQHETIDPKKNEDGDFVCENCGSALDVDVSGYVDLKVLKAWNETLIFQFNHVHLLLFLRTLGRR